MLFSKIGFLNFWISWGVKDYVAIQCIDYVDDKQWSWLIMFDDFETGFICLVMNVPVLHWKIIFIKKIMIIIIIFYRNTISKLIQITEEQSVLHYRSSIYNCFYFHFVFQSSLMNDLKTIHVKLLLQYTSTVFFLFNFCSIDVILLLIT